MNVLRAVGTAVLLLALVIVSGCATTEVTSTTTEASAKADDRTLLQQVVQQYMKHPVLKMERINVDVKNGVVTLTGKVRDPSVAVLAESVARKVPGVVGVNNNLTNP